MKYSAALIVSALAVLARAVRLTMTDYTITEGAPFTLTWTDSQDPVTIKLKTGASNDLKDVQTITSSGSGGSFTWTPGNLPSGTYAFEIIDSSGQNNYSPQWSYQGTGTLSTSSSTASSTTASASTSTSASTTGTSSTETKSTTSSARLTSTTMTPLTNSTTLSTSTSASTSKGPSTATTTSSSTTSSSSTVPNTNNGQRVASSLALVLGAVAAFIAFN